MHLTEANKPRNHSNNFSPNVCKLEEGRRAAIVMYFFFARPAVTITNETEIVTTFEDIANLFHS